MTGLHSLTLFHFLRPEALWLLLPAVPIFVALRRQGGAGARWRGVIAPHLLEHLIVRPERGWRVRPLHLLLVAVLVAVIAVAGPSWRREPPPFTQDTAPLVIALDLSESMLVEDVQPSRLERAKQKINDVLAGRKGARTALLAYAGSAHLVLPLTDDPAVIEAYVEDLAPSIMPVPGSDPVLALERAGAVLADETTPGTVVFFTSGIGADAAPAFATHEAAHRDQVMVLAVATRVSGPIHSPASAMHGTGGMTRERRAGCLRIRRGRWTRRTCTRLWPGGRMSGATRWDWTPSSSSTGPASHRLMSISLCGSCGATKTLR